MDTPTTVPELRRLLDAKWEAENEHRLALRTGEHTETIVAAECAQRAMDDFGETLTDATIAAMLTALEAAQDGCVTCIEAMESDRACLEGIESDNHYFSLEACERIRGCSHARTRAALAPLFPKEDDE